MKSNKENIQNILYLIQELSKKNDLIWNDSSKNILERAGLPCGSTEHKTAAFHGGFIHAAVYESKEHFGSDRVMIVFHKNGVSRTLLDDQRSICAQEILNALNFENPQLRKLRNLIDTLNP